MQKQRHSNNHLLGAYQNTVSDGMRFTEPNSTE